MIQIIGSGIIGLSIGYRLLKDGFNVEIFGHPFPGESSLAAVGMLAPLIEFKVAEKKLFDLMSKSKKMWDNFDKNLSKDSNLKSEYQKNNSLAIATTHDDLEKLKFKVKFYKKFGQVCKLLDKNQTNSLEPNLSTNIKGSIFFNENDQVNAQLFKKSLLKAFLKLGGKFYASKKIEGITIEKDKIKLITNFGDHNCNQVILAAGAWSREILLKSFNFSIPMRPIKGITMEFEHIEKIRLFRHNLWFRNIYIAPRIDGKIIVGATEEEVGFRSDVTMHNIFVLINNLWHLIPSSENYKFINFKSGLRPTTYDGLPIIGTLDNISKNLICAFGHYRNGILLAPITAQIISRILLNRNKCLFNFLSPNRFK